jgi:HPt (histidine-containing phosphotransfer) domain-containing protein
MRSIGSPAPPDGRRPIALDDAALERALAALGAKYLAENPARLAELDASLARAVSGDREALSELRMLLHRIAGSAGSYGFGDATDRARVAEADVARAADSGSPLTPEIGRQLAGRLAELRAAFPSES